MIGELRAAENFRAMPEIGVFSSPHRHFNQRYSFDFYEKQKKTSLLFSRVDGKRGKFQSSSYISVRERCKKK